MSSRDEILAAIGLLRNELRSLADRVDELEARVLSADSSELVGGPASTTARADTAVPSDHLRSEAAKQTGQYFQRALLGQSRGDSGRSRVKLQNRIYVVVRTFAGSVHTTPVQVYTKYSSVEAIVAEGGRGKLFGDSIFAGFPSAWEAKEAVREAGFSWPSSYD